MKKTSDLSPYTSFLPYASEIFGVYQPMLGWRSKRIQERIDKGFRNDISRLFETLYDKLKGKFEFELNDDRSLKAIRRLEPASLDSPRSTATGSFVVDSIASQLPPLSDYDDAVWNRVLQPARLQKLLSNEVVDKTTEWYRTTSAQERRTGRGYDDMNQLVADQLSRESALSGYLLYLRESRQFDKLKDLFYKRDPIVDRILDVFAYKDPLDLFDPNKDIDRAGLSPIGIVHLFRQFFFEFDTFLGPPVSHVWLSPAAEVELVEISTRRTYIERTLESSLETLVKTEKSATEEDELSEAVKEDNKTETKFGINTSVNQSWVGGSASASASIDMGTTQGRAREVTHRHMRQQTEKLSTEIRKNYKSTFKTITETTDTSSKRYLLSNKTKRLINYELRRKLRQVGVQVQDVGTYLCWQTYVDDPGSHLGISQLVHIAKGPDVGVTPPPESIPKPGTVETQLPIEIPFIPLKAGTVTIGDADVVVSGQEGDLDEGYRDGIEAEEDFNDDDLEGIQADFEFVAECDRPGYQYRTGSLSINPGGNDVRFSVTSIQEDPVGKITFLLHLDFVNFHNVSPLRGMVAKVSWEPTESFAKEVEAKNTQKLSEFNEQTSYEFQQAFVSAARERIKLASNIQPRSFQDLREEERIVVYRSLIQDMLTKSIPMPDDRTRHVVSELLNTIFDIDKMLYFVAPEWWRPRLHQSHQALGTTRRSAIENPQLPSPGHFSANTMFGKMRAQSKKNLIDDIPVAEMPRQITSSQTVTWGGENREDNYYITEESAPAKLGSSLGWLLQLDGDNLRNAFLNAPWVKAVIPIRPGKERAAINWLQRVHVEGTDGLDDQYVAPPDQLANIPHAGRVVTVRDAINHLCDVVAQKHADSQKVGRYPGDEINDDNRVSATPVDKVFEHGFYPLQGGFRATPGNEDFEVFDQWIEILPTDQIVPVEVTYDPKTGRQV